MKVKIKKLHKDAVVPRYAKSGDAAMDLTAVSINHDNSQDLDIFTVDFGISIEIPQGYVGLIFPRSSIYKAYCLLSNSVGVIDSGYRGPVMAKFYGDGSEFGYKAGDRCAQIMILPYPQIEFEEAEELSETDRSTGGFGSTGLN